MALRENERRILAEIEHRLSADDPELAGHLTSFGEDDPTFAAERGAGGGWRPWLVCGAIALVMAGLLVVLFLATPDGAPEPAATQPPPAPVTLSP
ncbi:DUF3040 domain-containing protein [Actinorugispora endophytica]|uniref:DUF3040 family protein n=1 Tax=Actinorugispora endophytica TaxID=1605990 RepID=A0A4R6V449_9ACTN|nr:DUF3040 domain-containing protein [Actinorugispora endophytica]TDQ53405.1 DUF3040 family protein [Actinorugispora endophytica]